MTENKYYSINSFMNNLKNKSSEDIEYIDLYFIPAQTFRNQFNNITIKPVAMLIKDKDKVKSFKYNDMITYLEHTPLISFKPNSDRRIYKKQQLQKLIIKNELKDYNEYQYYESKIITVNDIKVIEKIKSEVPESKIIKIDNDEVELFE